MIVAALFLSLALAWLNFVLTAKWAGIPGALNGPRWPFYGSALVAATALAVARRREIGRPVDTGRLVPIAIVLFGASTLIVATFARLPIGVWSQIPFKDDWTELYAQALNGVAMLTRGSVVGWNWWLQGGYPTSTDIGQNFALLGFVPMALFGPRVGYHLLHVLVLFALPVLVWRDMHEDGDETAAVTAGFTCLLASYYLIGFGNSGDTNSLMGVFSAAVALYGSGAARRGQRWGGVVLLAGLTAGLYSHPAFFVYAVILVALEAVYYRDRAVILRLIVTASAAAIASLPMHWESIRYRSYVSFNNTVFDPSAPKDWGLALRTVYYNVEILAFPHRWFNDYRSLVNVWLPAIAVAAIRLPRSRGGFYVWGTLLAQLLLRFNTSEAGAIFDRIQHMMPVLASPALAAFIVRFAGSRVLAAALVAVVGLYVPTTLVKIPHVPDVRAWDPALIDRIGAADGNTIVVEISPHRDMDRDPNRRTPRTPFDVHFEGLLPGVAGQRFYSQMIDGWVFNVWRGEVVAAGTWQGHPIDETPAGVFAAEMRRWGVTRLFVWTDRTRDYLARSGRFVERWRGGLWSEFEALDADTRSAVVPRGHASLRNLDWFGGDLVLDGVTAGDPVVVRTHYYPAWRAYDDDRSVALFPVDGQLAFAAPRDGSYTVHLAYPRYRLLATAALAALVLGAWLAVHLENDPRRR